jgi:hypothetical protein
LQLLLDQLGTKNLAVQTLLVISMRLGSSPADEIGAENGST